MSHRLTSPFLLVRGLILLSPHTHLWIEWGTLSALQSGGKDLSLQLYILPPRQCVLTSAQFQNMCVLRKSCLFFLGNMFLCTVLAVAEALSPPYCAYDARNREGNRRAFAFHAVCRAARAGAAGRLSSFLLSFSCTHPSICASVLLFSRRPADRLPGLSCQ